jgi:endonuclease/exonuclease/phosphatase family metal-dependent hydrolase
VTQLTIASLNTRGMPVFGSRLTQRYAAIGDVFEKSDVDVVNFQEVLTYVHLRLLVRSLPSFRFVSWQRSLAGPAGGLVTMSRSPVVATEYQRFPTPTDAHEVPRLLRLLAPLKGALLTELGGVSVVNTHLLANRDGDWSTSNRFFPLHRDQLAALGRFVAAVPRPATLTGDFNVARDSDLYVDFVRDTGLVDVFPNSPPTFHAAYLGPHQSPHCIDFVFVSDRAAAVESAGLIFTDQVPMSGGPDYVSDHLGLQVRLVF